MRTPAAELDLVARRRGVLACVEVKGARAPWLPRPAGGAPIRPPPEREPGARLRGRALQRQLRAAAWLARSSAPGARARVDLIEVLVRPGTRYLEIRHHEGLEAPLVGSPPRRDRDG